MIKKIIESIFIVAGFLTVTALLVPPFRKPYESWFNETTKVVDEQRTRLVHENRLE